MTGHLDHIASDCIALDFNRLGGNFQNVVFTSTNGEVVRPLHTAPWAQDAALHADDIALVEGQLSGDFFCAPFGASQGQPIHGWTANGTWHAGEKTGDTDGARRHTYRLRETVQGASVTKTLTVRPGHPFIYQRHTFNGGTGHLPAGHHAMIRTPGGARLSFSQKLYGMTPNAELESDPTRGRSILTYPQRITRLDQVEGKGGATHDIRDYPFSSRHEDIVLLAGDPELKIGWSAALAKADGFLFFAVKDATALPETVLWMSNGGRDYAPWLGRHTHVLGIEEVVSSCHETGEFSSTADVSRAGLAQGLCLGEDRTSEIAYGFGAIPAPDGWRDIADIAVDRTSLTLLDAGGDSVTLPFDGAHFGL
ncbi:hypothetical protein [Hoeflea prorocentri]|uniref:Uncharacterized protein n=1 Tax=Hoeflea prorocentri TaxID=1922333 RepID=A0A9X3UM97_9HYPH|nr:hypothetical protein [Hoeflea prorocentri]MCY6381784.1 hypothetical protein [Hoeflea prorocentri]MDA5399584.1 hypothetical protein [Hoeflea prorocentri]